MINRQDLGVAVILLAVSGWLYHVSAGFDEVSPLFAQDVPPELFPRMLVWVIVALTLAIPFERRLRKEKGKVLDKARAQPIRPIAYLSVAFLGLGVAAIQWVGTYLVLVLVALGLPLLWGERRWRILIPYALVFPTVVIALFSKGLGVRFEPGAFGPGLF